MQLWTAVTTVLGDLLALASGAIALTAAVRANRRPPRGCRRHRKG